MDNSPVLVKRPIPFFSVQVINTIDDYIRFRNVRTYISEKYEAYCEGKKESEAAHALMTASGYAKYEKWCEHSYYWHLLNRRIPLSYLEALDIHLDALECAREADEKEFEAALKVPRFPKAAIIRVFAAMYDDLKFPKGTTEEEAIAITTKFSREKRVSCCINYGNLLSLWIEPDGEDGKITYYRPKYTLTKFWLVPDEDGESNGQSWM